MNNFHEKDLATSENNFGELLRATGPMAKANPLRFSTKYQDDETDLLYYGLRYYSAPTGRWLSADPISERGGVNLYAFLGNAATERCDSFGLASARETLNLIVSKIFERYLNRKTVATTGYLPAMARYRSLIPRIGVDYEDLRKVMALYYPSDHHMALDKEAIPGIGSFPTVSHELAHAYDDLVLSISDDVETDEAMGYSIGAIASVVEALTTIEITVAAHDCPGIYSLGHIKWQNFWNAWGHIPANTWGTVAWSGAIRSHKRNLTAADLAKFSALHGGVGLSCNAVADALNEIIWEKGCCRRFVCDAALGPGEMGTGIKINAFFN